MIKSLDLPALKKLCDAATLDWRLHEGFNRFEVNPGCYGLYLEFGNDGCVLVSAFRKNVELAVAARTAVPQLIEELETEKQISVSVNHVCDGLEKENTALKAEVERLMELTANGTLEELRSNTTRQIQDMAIQTQINADKRERRLEKENHALRELLAHCQGYFNNTPGHGVPTLLKRIDAALEKK